MRHPPARQALAHGTIHGARCLGREADLGSLEVGKLGDVALWKLDDLGGAGIIDPVASLVLGPPRGAWPGSCWPDYEIDYPAVEAYMDKNGDLQAHLDAAPEAREVAHG